MLGFALCHARRTRPKGSTTHSLMRSGELEPVLCFRVSGASTLLPSGSLVFAVDMGLGRFVN